jgi:hypothetical protein
MGLIDRLLGGVGLWPSALAATGLAQLGTSALLGTGVAAELARQPADVAELWYGVLAAAGVLLLLGAAAGWSAPVAVAGIAFVALDCALTGPAELQLFITLAAFTMVLVHLAPVVLRLLFMLSWGSLVGWRVFTRWRPY